jgi:hypothetical protein
MTITKSKALLSPGSLATLGFGVILAGFSVAPAQALVVNPGTDYLRTPATGANFVFDPPGGLKVAIPYSGLPIQTPTPNGALFSPTAQPNGTPSISSPPNPDGGYAQWFGKADTVVNRLDAVNAAGDGGSTRLNIVGLSLYATDVFGSMDSVVGLQRYYGDFVNHPLNPLQWGQGPQSTGTMTIRAASAPDPDGVVTGLWDSQFTIKAVAFFAPKGTLLQGDPFNPLEFNEPPDHVRTIVSNISTPMGPIGELYACESGTILGQCLLIENTFSAVNEAWKSVPFLDTIQGENLVPEIDSMDPITMDPLNYKPMNFYTLGEVKHIAGGGTIHIVVDDVPGPLPILGVASAFSFSRRLRRNSRRLGGNVERP